MQEKMYNEEEIYNKVKSIIVEQLGVKDTQVSEEATFVEDLGADSLDTVELVMAFEEEFGIDIPDEDAEKMTTVGEVVNYIINRVSAKEEAEGGKDLKNE